MPHINRLITLTSLLVLSVSLTSCKDDSAIQTIENTNNDSTIKSINKIITDINDNDPPNTTNNAAPVCVITINETAVFSESYDPEGISAMLYWTVDNKVFNKINSFTISAQNYTGTQDVTLYVYDGNSIAYCTKSVEFKSSTSDSGSDDSTDDSDAENNYPYDY
ncbi:MAG: hypothetical protein HRU38_20870 [Saccharospirillaceae bacterium]|nr:hypothetical protein [Pseudomonadales bacterium]NRB81085.1 hypothetical protein [Saccharospirillaceae bacterium]